MQGLGVLVLADVEAVAAVRAGRVSRKSRCYVKAIFLERVLLERVK